MDLTQRTHGRLLAALSFNNRYLSPPSSSPSIRSVSQRFVLFCLFVLAFPTCFLFPFLPCFFHMLPPSSLNTFQIPYFLWLFFCLRSFFSSPLAAWLSHHYSISSSAALPPFSFHLSITTSAGPIHSRKDSLKLGICCQRDSEAHAEVTCSFMPSFPAIQIKSEKNESLEHLKTHVQSGSTFPVTLSCQGDVFVTSLWERGLNAYSSAVWPRQEVLQVI